MRSSREWPAAAAQTLGVFSMYGLSGEKSSSMHSARRPSMAAARVLQPTGQPWFRAYLNVAVCPDDAASKHTFSFHPHPCSWRYRRHSTWPPRAAARVVSSRHGEGAPRERACFKPSMSPSAAKRVQRRDMSRVRRWGSAPELLAATVRARPFNEKLTSTSDSKAVRGRGRERPLCNPLARTKSSVLKPGRTFHEAHP